MLHKKKKYPAGGIIETHKGKEKIKIAVNPICKKLTILYPLDQFAPFIKHWPIITGPKVAPIPQKQ